MIHIVLRDNGMWALGHSGYAPKGQDVVCAAVSILMEAAAAELEAQNRLVLSCFGEGMCTLTAAQDCEALDMARQGLFLLARHYGDYMEIRDLRKGRNDHAERS